MSPANPSPSTIARESGLIGALWTRDMLRLKKERSRWLGVVAQPLMFWFFIGSGMVDKMAFDGTDGDYLTYFFPGIIVMTILFTTIFATMSVIEDRQSGFLQGILIGPSSRPAMVLGKLSGVTTLALLQCVLLVAFAPVAGYALGEIAWVPFFGLVFMTSMALGALNFASAWILNSTQAYHGFMSVLLLPLWILSGAMYPHPGSGWLEWVMTFNPMAYAVDGIRLALSGGGLPLEHASDLTGAAFALSAFFGLFFIWTLRVTRRL